MQDPCLRAGRVGEVGGSLQVKTDWRGGEKEGTENRNTSLNFPLPSSHMLEIEITTWEKCLQPRCYLPTSVASLLKV